jgi:hypothetical protein
MPIPAAQVDPFTRKFGGKPAKRIKSKARVRTVKTTPPSTGPPLAATAISDGGLPDPAAWIAGKLLPAPPPELIENERERFWGELKKLLRDENDELKTRLSNYLRDYLGAPTPMSTIVLLTPRETAKHLRCSERKLERHRLVGDGPPFVKIGAAIRYPLSELEKWLAGHMHRSTSETP